MADQADRGIEFWKRTFDKLYWLGAAGVIALGINTAIVLSKKKKKHNKAETTTKVEKNEKRVARKDSLDPLHGMPPLSLEGVDHVKPSRKGSMIPHDPMNLHLIHRIVFTGGPCGGKTTAISTCSETLKELGHGVICVPEAASLIFSQGGVLNMATYTPYQGIEFQMALMKLQIALEDIFSKIVSINLKSKHIYVLCDRGLMDGSAYLSKEQWEVLLNEMGLYEQDIREERYDQVIHMTTAADGAEPFYNLKGNAARSEDISLAVDLDQRLRNGWMAHPSYFLISNDCKDFDTKIKMAENCLLKMQGSPTHSQFSRKYLVSNRDGLFNRIINDFKVETFVLTDTYLDAKLGSTKVQGAQIELIYLRKREHNSRLTFLKGQKCYMKDGASFSTKRNILWKEYSTTLGMYKDTHKTLVRNRCMILVNDSYIKLDLFERDGVEFVVMLVQSSDRFNKQNACKQLMELSSILPAYITKNFVEDISNQDHYRLDNMADPNWTLGERIKKELNTASLTADDAVSKITISTAPSIL